MNVKSRFRASAYSERIKFSTMHTVRVFSKERSVRDKAKDKVSRISGSRGDTLM